MFQRLSDNSWKLSCSWSSVYTQWIKSCSTIQSFSCTWIVGSTRLFRYSMIVPCCVARRGTVWLPTSTTIFPSWEPGAGTSAKRASHVALVDFATTGGTGPRHRSREACEAYSRRPPWLLSFRLEGDSHCVRAGGHVSEWLPNMYFSNSDSNVLGAQNKALHWLFGVLPAWTEWLN